MHSLVKRVCDSHLCVIVGVAKWCAIAIPANQLADGLFSVGCQVQEVYATGLLQWVAIPYVPAGPRYLQGHYPGIPLSHGILLRQTSPERSLVRHMFHHPAAMVDYATATLLASRLALEFGHGQ